jgi:hypothetical protein
MMKKVIIAASGILLLAFVVILFVNAQNNIQETKKAATEITKGCSKCPSAASCPKMAYAKKTSCDKVNYKAGKCDPATCKANCVNAKGEIKSCDPGKCKPNCQMDLTVRKQPSE